MSDFEAVIRWYAALTLVTIAFVPLIVALIPGRPGIAYGIARPLSLVLITAIVWWPAALLGLPFSRIVILFVVVAVGLIGWTLTRRSGVHVLDVQSLVAFELLWIAAFLGYITFRSYHPDIINTEKPMEIALLTSVSVSNDVPAPDPWLAGSPINYYYFGYQTFATLIKLTGVPTSVAFNLALATVFASIATSAAACGVAIARVTNGGRRSIIASATLAPILVLLAGNLETTRRLVQDWRATVHAGWWDGVGWQASRIITDVNVHQPGDSRQTINEFPAFSFVLGDLHPHVVTYPLLAAVLALAITVATARTPPGALRLMVMGSLVGLLYASNSWDAPLGMLLFVGALALHYRHDYRATLTGTATLIVGALVSAFPFLIQYSAPVGVMNSELPVWLSDLPVIGTLASTFGIVYWRPTSARDLVTVHGPWIAASAALAVVYLRDDDSLISAIRHRPHAALTAAILALGVAVAWAPAIVIIGVPLALSTWITIYGRDPQMRLIAGLFATGFFLVLVPEFVFLQDVFLDRMNTVFKFYFQAWMILSVASAAAAVLCIRRIRPPIRSVAVVLFGAAIIAMLTYTPLSAWDWTQGFANRTGIDGRAYMLRSAPADLAAIAWLEQHADQDDILVEAPGCSYLVLDGAPMSRVSAYSGYPTLLGWWGHQSQWRRGESRDIDRLLRERMDEANRILDGGVPPSATEVRFIVLGRQELGAAGRCDRVTERPPDVRERLRQNGWTTAFSVPDMEIFVASDDPLAASDR